MELCYVRFQIETDKRELFVCLFIVRCKGISSNKSMCESFVILFTQSECK